MSILASSLINHQVKKENNYDTLCIVSTNADIAVYNSIKHDTTIEGLRSKVG